MATQRSSKDKSDGNLELNELRSYVTDILETSIDSRELRKRGSGAMQELAITTSEFIEFRVKNAISVRVWNPTDHREGRTAIEVAVKDQPFLVDTLRINFKRLGLRELLFLHPILPLERDDAGRVSRMGTGDMLRDREAYLYAEVALLGGLSNRQDVEREIRDVIDMTRNIVADHGRMVKSLRRHMADIEFCTTVIDSDEQRSDRLLGFLNWLVEDNFIFLGHRYYNVTGDDGSWRVQLVQHSGLGILRDSNESRFSDETAGADIPALVRSRLADPRLIFFDKSRQESIFHRGGRLDCISIKTLDESGRVIGFGRFVGLLTHKAVRSRGSQVPILRERCQRVLAAIGAERGSHTYKAAVEAFDSLPVEVLFQFEVEDITRACEGVILASESRKVEVCVVPDPLSRSFFVSVILPRPLYDESLRQILKDLFVRKYQATYVDSRSSFLDDEAALIHFFCSSASDVDLDLIEELEQDVKSHVTRWEDRFEAALLGRHQPREAYTLTDAYAALFSEEYKILTPVPEAVADVDRLEKLRAEQSEVEIGLYDDPDSDENTVKLKVYQSKRPYLTDLLPVLDNFGLRVVDATLTEVNHDSNQSWIVAFRVQKPEGGFRKYGLEQRILDGLRATLRGWVENDSLNRLIVGAGFRWQDADVFRAYLAYAQQVSIAPDRQFASDVLLNYPDATQSIFEFFCSRLDPAKEADREDRSKQAWLKLKKHRRPIPTADEDRVFGLFENLVESTWRTNFFVPAEAGVHVVSFKLNSREIKGIPAPKPHAEIFVNSAEMSGVHLRGGKVARGGIRWSDRQQDFRTEILGLMKTQMTKNGLIVPVGAKGGFILKQRFQSGSDARAEADRIYACFIRALLRLTDNKSADQIIPPEHVVRYDEDDPYLVVAADKGTAHLSDVANSVANDVGFWLDDAFASGGSNGYDHKKEGITAHGAWVCVKRHFLEVGVDAEKETFTVAGIGDMSGDVFGNGLLYARMGKLQAAFNHIHIFIDPDPDPDSSWHERKRLFETPGTTWDDYAKNRISRGGGVFDRSAKEIPLSSEMKQLLGIEEDTQSGEEIIRAILRMPVDLLWNGGIGTYVMASTETHAGVGDRANASVRVSANELRARIIGEGGNLGFTQLARIEYALLGGRLNTDAIDNSGGVDLSDHEVNFKILLAEKCASNGMTFDERNQILRSCVKEADDRVLDHNAAQSRCVSMDLMRTRQDPDRMALATEFLGTEVDLDARIEFLPEREDLRARAGRDGTEPGYTRPELAVLLGYTKMLCKRALVESNIPEHEFFKPLVEAYFPESLVQTFHSEITQHPMKREIIATVLTNQVIDQAGITLVPELVRALGCSVADVIAGYHTVDCLLDADQIRDAIAKQDVSEMVRIRMAVRLEDALRTGAVTMLGAERCPALDLASFKSWKKMMGELVDQLPSHLGDAEDLRVRHAVESWTEEGVDPSLAAQIESLGVLAQSIGLLSLAGPASDDLVKLLELQNAVGEVTRIRWLLNRLRDIDRRDNWDRIAAESLYLELLSTQRLLVEGFLSEGAAANAYDDFLTTRKVSLDRIQETAVEIEADERSGLAAYSVLAQQIRRLL